MMILQLRKIATYYKSTMRRCRALHHSQIRRQSHLLSGLCLSGTWPRQMKELFVWIKQTKHVVPCAALSPQGNSEKLQQAFQESASVHLCSDDLQALIAAYKNAPSKNLKTQILSIYASRYSGRFLKKMNEPFEKLSDRPIKKARAHARNVGVGFNVEKLPSHRV